MNPELQSEISRYMKSGEYGNVYSIIEQGVDEKVIEELKKKHDPHFDEAIRQTLSMTSEATPIYQGNATAVLVDMDGGIKAFFSNNQDSPDHATFVKAAIEKATARVLLEKKHKKGGLSRHQELLLKQGFLRHEGASIKPVKIDGENYFIGVSGASVDDSFNRKALRNDELFGATGEDPEWRAAGYWDRFCANRIMAFMTRDNVRKDIGAMKIPHLHAEDDFFD
ncbi:hypothetical protein COY62_02250 [bacterium (Candidatus Howlettbacteria) CG_4_10_14_0_8_um_filter_40_9]|nr:MAG: hypothetical protein COY62_02250 [bacterium (Candidatus Howlettbacteria) CG_4_10_14_0_8_um_filter_40_9]